MVAATFLLTGLVIPNALSIPSELSVASVDKEAEAMNAVLPSDLVGIGVLRRPAKTAKLFTGTDRGARSRRKAGRPVKTIPLVIDDILAYFRSVAPEQMLPCNVLGVFKTDFAPRAETCTK